MSAEMPFGRTHLRGWLRVAVLIVSVAGAGVAHADGFGVKAGTAGLGVEFLWDPLPLSLLDVRLGVNHLSLSHAFAANDIDYDGNVRLSSYYAVASLNLPLTPLRITGGLYANGNRANLTAQPAATYEIGDRTYTAAEAGTLRGRLDFERLAPYTGIGLDFGLLGLGLSLDAGVLWQGSPRLGLTADGALADDPDFQEDLERERARAERELSRYRLYPVISATFYLRF